jgi:ADP-ribose pyrophosphatase
VDDEKLRIHAEETLSDGFLKLTKYTVSHRRFDGGWIGPMTREVVLRPLCVAVLPYDPIADKILLIEQFRLAAHLAGMAAWQREIIAGMNDKNESPETIVRREALEEADCPLTDLVEIYRYLPTPGITNENIVMYCGRMDSRGRGGVFGLDDEHEDIRATLHDFAEVPGILTDSHGGNGLLIMSLQWLMLNRDRLRREWR